MRAILSAPGSRGDVNPMIAIGKSLVRAGCEVVISLAEPYADLASEAGLVPEPVVDRDRFTELLGNEYFWKPIRGARAVLRELAGEFLALHDEVIHRHHSPGETVLVSHPLDLASRIFRDTDPSTPLVDVQLQPSILRTFDSPPRLSPFWFEVMRPPWAVRAAYWIIDYIAVDPVIAPKVNAMRRTRGLDPVRRIMHRWWISPDRILAMYPPWYAPATQDFCPQLIHCGFPLDDISGQRFDPPPGRPIVFTSGTAHHHCRPFFERAVKACAQLDRPGLLLSTFDRNFPPELPGSMTAMSYASFGQLLPHCSAIVHHGGIGTTSQAIAAGIPQVIQPLAFDQFDNATRVERLRCGRWLRRQKDLATILRDVLCDDETATATRRKLASQLQPGAAADAAAAEIMKMFDRQHPPDQGLSCDQR